MKYDVRLKNSSGIDPEKRFPSKCTCFKLDASDQEGKDLTENYEKGPKTQALLLHIENDL